MIVSVTESGDNVNRRNHLGSLPMSVVTKATGVQAVEQKGNVGREGEAKIRTSNTKPLSTTISHQTGSILQYGQMTKPPSRTARIRQIRLKEPGPGLVETPIVSSASEDAGQHATTRKQHGSLLRTHSLCMFEERIQVDIGSESWSRV